MTKSLKTAPLVAAPTKPDAAADDDRLDEPVVAVVFVKLDGVVVCNCFFIYDRPPTNLLTKEPIQIK